MCFFFSSRRRHTRCALVTGVRRVLFRSRHAAAGARPARGSAVAAGSAQRAGIGQGPPGRGLHHSQRGRRGQRDRRKHLLRADVMNDEHDDRDATDDKRRHPLREPMIWLVIALPLAAVLGGIWMMVLSSRSGSIDSVSDDVQRTGKIQRSEEHTSELQSLMRISYAVFCLNKKK